jgi:hypothetical protein
LPLYGIVRDNISLGSLLSALRLEPSTGRAGTRSLTRLVKSGSTSRMLNLGEIALKHGDDAVHREFPLFKNRQLNRCIILKHRVRSEERVLFKPAPPIATKLLFPFDWNDLSLGGRSIMVGERNFRLKLGGSLGRGDAIPFTDWETMRLIDQMPSLDPFLLRERLRQGPRKVAETYYQLSPADAARMHAHVAGHLRQLIDLAFGRSGKSGAEAVHRIVDALMAMETDERLEPLRLTLGLAPDEFREAVFCWKGFLYYKWSASDHEAGLARLTYDVHTLRSWGAPRKQDELDLKIAQGRLVETIESEWQAVRAALQVYDDAYDDLVRNGKSAAFRRFLRNSPQMFLDMGEKLGALGHLASYWRFLFPHGLPDAVEFGTASELIRDFVSAVTKEKPQAMVWA